MAKKLQYHAYKTQLKTKEVANELVGVAPKVGSTTRVMAPSDFMYVYTNKQKAISKAYIKALTKIEKSRTNPKTIVGKVSEIPTSKTTQTSSGKMSNISSGKGSDPVDKPEAVKTQEADCVGCCFDLFTCSAIDDSNDDNKTNLKSNPKDDDDERNCCSKLLTYFICCFHSRSPDKPKSVTLKNGKKVKTYSSKGKSYTIKGGKKNKSKSVSKSRSTKTKSKKK